MTVQVNDGSVWRAFDESELTHSAAHYLTTIMYLRTKNGYARVTDVADQLGVSRGAVSRAVALLKERGLIEEDPNRMLLLTDDGMERARSVERNFIIVECFLEDILGVPPAVAREDACKMEHLLSSETTTAMLRLIGLLNANKPLRERVKRNLEGDASGAANGDQVLCESCKEYDSCIQAVKSLGSDRPLGSLLGEASGGPYPDQVERTLAHVAPGERAVIRRVRGEGPVHRRILDMGLSKGTLVEVERIAPLRDPIKVKVRGYALSLRKKEALLIEVEPAAQ